jgi:hypothetical protein
LQIVKLIEAEVQASLFIIGCTPDEITPKLSILPSETHRKGDIRRNDPKGENPPVLYKDHVWILHSPLSKEEEIENHLKWLLDQVRPHAEAMKEIGEQYYAMISYTCFFYEYGQGFRLEKEVLKELADLNIVFDFDVYSPSMQYLEHAEPRDALRKKLDKIPLISTLNAKDHDESRAIVHALAVLEKTMTEDANDGITDLFWAWEDTAQDEQNQYDKEALEKIGNSLNKILRQANKSIYLKQYLNLEKGNEHEDTT